MAYLVMQSITRSAFALAMAASLGACGAPEEEQGDPNSSVVVNNSATSTSGGTDGSGGSPGGLGGESGGGTARSGACNGTYTDQQGNSQTCAGERPVCYADGSCICMPDSDCPDPAGAESHVIN